MATWGYTAVFRHTHIMNMLTHQTWLVHLGIQDSENQIYHLCQQTIWVIYIYYIDIHIYFMYTWILQTFPPLCPDPPSLPHCFLAPPIYRWRIGFCWALALSCTYWSTASRGIWTMRIGPAARAWLSRCAGDRTWTKKGVFDQWISRI